MSHATVYTAQIPKTLSARFITQSSLSNSIRRDGHSLLLLAVALNVHAQRCLYSLQCYCHIEQFFYYTPSTIIFFSSVEAVCINVLHQNCPVSLKDLLIKLTSNLTVLSGSVTKLNEMPAPASKAIK